MKVVVVAIDRIFRAVVGLAAPRAVSIAGPAGEEIDQVLIAVGNVGQTEFILPVADVFLRRLVILAPVVPAGIKVIDLIRADGPDPAKADDIGLLNQIVIVGIQSRQGGRTIRAERLVFQVVPIVAGNPVLAVKVVIDLDALLVDRIDLGSGDRPSR